MLKKFFNKISKHKIFIFIFAILLLYYLNKPLQEGVVFTPYDNANWFNKPWDKFCIQTPPSCQKLSIDHPNIKGNPQIGCWCNNEQKAPQLDHNCTDIEFDPFIEYRR